MIQGSGETALNSLNSNLTSDQISDHLEDLRYMARDRTDWALHRTLLANERTFSAWVRTGLASEVAGLGVAGFLQYYEGSEMAGAIGIILILAGGGFYAIGLWRYYHASRELGEMGMRVTSAWIFGLIVAALVMSTALALIMVYQWD